MIQIFQDTGGKRIVTFYGELDLNFIAVCNAIIKIANPALNLLGYASAANEPAAPSENDCYLVADAGDIWELTAEKDDIILWNGLAWEIYTYKISELNTVLQELYFSAANISCTAPAGMTATDVQSAIDELAAAVFGA